METYISLFRSNYQLMKQTLQKKKTLVVKNKNDHRSGGAVKEGCPYICIKHIIKLNKKNKCLLINICVNCTIRRIKGSSSIVN